MNLFLDTHLELIQLLIQRRVDFIIIGGYAVIYHGYHRTTGDVDIWLKPDNENKSKLIKALEDYGIESTSLRILELMNFEKHQAIQIGNEPDKIEFLTHIQGVKFEEADRQKITAEIDHLPVPFLHLHHLILSKLSTGRLKDQADIEELQKINQRKFKP